MKITLAVRFLTTMALVAEAAKVSIQSDFTRISSVFGYRYIDKNGSGNREVDFHDGIDYPAAVELVPKDLQGINPWKRPLALA